jgi:hypothetical protein
MSAPYKGPYVDAERPETVPQNLRRFITYAYDSCPAS